MRLPGRRTSQPRPTDDQPTAADPPATGAGFFERHPGFLETTGTSAYPWRLDLRHRAIFDQHRDLFPGRRVLDIACHDGRWSLAALEAGAQHVTGIEGRADLAEHARGHLRAAGVADTRHRFLTGDVFATLADEPVQVDVVLCLGFLYHTLRHHELLARIRATGARDLVVDTVVDLADRPVISVSTERVDKPTNAVADGFTHGERALVGAPSMRALRLICRSQGFELVDTVDWDALLREHPDARNVADYREGRRVTAHFRRDDA